MAVNDEMACSYSDCLGEAQNTGCQAEGVVGSRAQEPGESHASRLLLSFSTYGNRPTNTLVEMTSAP